MTLAFMSLASMICQRSSNLFPRQPRPKHAKKQFKRFHSWDTAKGSHQCLSAWRRIL